MDDRTIKWLCEVNESLREAINYATDIGGIEWLRSWSSGDPDAMAELEEYISTGKAKANEAAKLVKALRARAKYAAMTPEQQAAHDIAQRESFVRSQLGPEDRQTVPMESTHAE